MKLTGALIQEGIDALFVGFIEVTPERSFAV